jgi:hypothetical protein
MTEEELNKYALDLLFNPESAQDFPEMREVNFLGFAEVQKLGAHLELSRKTGILWRAKGPDPYVYGEDYILQFIILAPEDLPVGITDRRAWSIVRFPSEIIEDWDDAAKTFLPYRSEFPSLPPNSILHCNVSMETLERAAALLETLYVEIEE